MITKNDIETISRKLSSLQDKILKNKFAESVTESEMMSLVLTVNFLNNQQSEIDILQKRVSDLKHALFEQQCYTATLQKELAGDTE